MIIAGSALMIIPMAVLFAFAGSVKILGDFANMVFVLHGMFCTLVGVVLVAVGAARTRA
jgi:hypothetical protein